MLVLAYSGTSMEFLSAGRDTQKASDTFGVLNRAVKPGNCRCSIEKVISEEVLQGPSSRSQSSGMGISFTEDQVVP